MKRRLRETGIKVLGAVPWGTHVCLFYDAQRDLLETLVPYFKAGLSGNELCLWVLSESLSEQESKRALKKVIPDFAHYQAKKQIELVPFEEWYVKNGVFDADKVIAGWSEKVEKALAEGYDGLRVTGDLFWHGGIDKKRFAEYEAKADSIIAKYSMLSLCTYSVGYYTAGEVLDVILAHRLTLFRQGNTLVLRDVAEQRGIAPPAAETLLSVVQKRFVASGFKGLDDRDAIELVLSLCLPPEESRSRAQACLEQFHTLRDFLSASQRELKRTGIPPRCMFFVELLRQLPAELLKQQIIAKPAYPSSREVFDYLYYSMRDLKKEIFKVIYLDNRNRIIEVADLFIGSVDRAPVHPREIIESAINTNAVSLIFVHNHPSGDPTPSRVDKRLSRDLVFMGMLMQIKVLDHIIVGANKYFSFADEGLIQKYEDDFLNLQIRLPLGAER
ncbi:MAG: DNA repair protein RadC [Chloroflexi bacterium]|nr:DNA repair protein RadC [Chloroflexota bacterium]